MMSQFHLILTLQMLAAWPSQPSDWARRRGMERREETKDQREGEGGKGRKGGDEAGDKGRAGEKEEK